jgi:hypothetical protein
MEKRGLPGMAGLDALHLWRESRLVHLPGTRMREARGDSLWGRHLRLSARLSVAYPSQRESADDRAESRKGCTSELSSGYDTSTMVMSIRHSRAWLVCWESPI